MSQDVERQGSGQDFIVSELISEQKEENVRKERLIQKLIKSLVASIAGGLCATLLVTAGFLWYLNQYDFSSTETHTAEGVYAIVDSEGNVITSDLTPEQLQELIEKGLTIDGEGYSDQN